MRSRPDVLVLGGGGMLGEAWMSGVLAGLEAAGEVDFTRCEYFVGTSAGAIVAAQLAAGVHPRRPEHPEAVPSPPRADTPSELQRLEAAARAGIETAAGLAGPWIRLGLALTEPTGALARAAALRALPTGSGDHDDLRARLASLDSTFDGRLRIVAVDAETGRRVVFGSPGALGVTVADAVAASCAFPTRFEPQRMDGEAFVDGGVWSPTNLDAAPVGRGALLLCLSPTASTHGPLNPFIRHGSRAIATLEIAAARSAGVKVELVTPDRASAAAIGTDPMAGDRAESTLAAGYAQGLAL